MSSTAQSRSAKITGALNDAIRGASEAATLLSAGKSLLDAERVIWDAYSQAEHAIFALKLECGESAVPTVRKIKSDSEGFGESVRRAAEELQAGLDAYGASKFSEALTLARTGRNRLRKILVEARKIRKKPLLGPTPLPAQ
ncbi:MAG: hypothetical protein HYU39_02415 [Thaumarchaeota archaeon]|nr:hypothetical protein [Nitrososphaerota archaeon]